MIAAALGADRIGAALDRADDLSPPGTQSASEIQVGSGGSPKDRCQVPLRHERLRESTGQGLCGNFWSRSPDDIPDTSPLRNADADVSEHFLRHHSSGLVIEASGVRSSQRNAASSSASIRRPPSRAVAPLGPINEQQLLAAPRWAEARFIGLSKLGISVVRCAALPVRRRGEDSGDG
jgi:hypothetical protein